MTTLDSYVGAQTCDLVLELAPDLPPEAQALLREWIAGDPGDTSTLDVLADWFEEFGRGQLDDCRRNRLRLASCLWHKCGLLPTDGELWNYDLAKEALTKVTSTLAGWRLSCLWGCLVAWHAPSGTGVPMGQTWADVRVSVAWRGVFLWVLGLTQNQEADAAWSQADAAWSQTYAAGSQADAVWSQADAAWSQAYAAGSQAYAAGSQADAARSQADAARSQADAARSQADAAGRQTSQEVWAFARGAWELCLECLDAFD